MAKYSTYEAKARFSELLREVRAGRSVIITYHGTEIAEIRPIQKSENSIRSRIQSAEQRGTVSLASNSPGPFPPLARRPGGLSRFLESRD